ncbi:MAG TPA: ArsR family transcriptional regulator [bacterium]|nr:ArsR family transcriptional regulator [bacterium]
MKDTVKIFKALSDPNRIRIIKLLESQPLCVCEITAILGLAASTVSKHLSILKAADLIFDQKENRWVNYHLNRATRHPHAREMLAYLAGRLAHDPLVCEDREKAARVNRETIAGGQRMHRPFVSFSGEIMNGVKDELEA